MPTADEQTLARQLLTEPWLRSGAEKPAISWAIEHGVSDRLDAVRETVGATVSRTRQHVRQRLLQEINHWDHRHAQLRDQETAGKQPKMNSDRAAARARDLEHRLETRSRSLDADEALRPKPPVVTGGALVLPAGLLQRLAGDREHPVATYAKDTAEVDRRAVAAVMAAERTLGRVPVEMPHNNPGYDIRSRTTDGHWVFIEVKGRILGADDFTVTRNEVLFGKSADHYRLALVSVHPDGAAHDTLRYVTEPFKDFDFGDFSADGVRGNWGQMWGKGVPPQ